MGQLIWFTGLSGAGKTTLSNSVEEELIKLNKKVLLLDGDILRNSIHKSLDFSAEGIKKNHTLILELIQKRLPDFDFVLVSVIAPFEESREDARQRFGNQYFEIFVKADLEVVKKRDVKGLYKKAINGEIPNFIGISPSVPYEIPKMPNLIIQSDIENIQQSTQKILQSILGHL